MELTADRERVVRKQRLGFVATVGPDGWLNVSPKGCGLISIPQPIAQFGAGGGPAYHFPFPLGRSAKVVVAANCRAQFFYEPTSRSRRDLSDLVSWNERSPAVTSGKSKSSVTCRFAEITRSAQSAGEESVGLARNDRDLCLAAFLLKVA